MARRSPERAKSFHNFKDSISTMPDIKEKQSASTLAPHLSDQEEINDHIITMTKPSWRSLFVFTNSKHYIRLFSAILFAILASLLKPAAALIFGRLFSTFTSYGAGKIDIQETMVQTAIWCICLTALGAGAWFLDGIWFLQWLSFGELQAKHAREQIFETLLNKSMRWYDLQEDGIASLMVRIQTQIRELQLSVSQPFGVVIYETSAVLSSLILGLYSSWQLTLVIFATFPIAALVLWLVSRKLSPAIESQKRDLTLATKYAETAINAISTVKVCNGQNQEVWQYYKAMKAVAQGYLVQARANSMQFGVIKFFTVVIFVQGFWYGLHLVRGGLDAGNVVTTFYSCLSAIQAAEIVLPQWLVLTKGMSAGATLQSLLTEDSCGQWSESQMSGIKPETFSGDIEVKSVTFAYPSNPKQNVLCDASFFFPAGEISYILGKSGSGKSTIGNLLLKYYQSYTGTIVIDGHDLTDLDTTWIRKHVTLVQQQSILFNDTIYRNIAFGSHKASTDWDIWEAAKTADLEQTLADLSNGLHTMIGSNGKSLSGGQQQRVAIARARLRDAPILILDEATSALDGKSKKRVNDLIRKWRTGKTTIIITHDVSQILDPEYVYVMDHGMVVQEGYRRKLAGEHNGAFANFLLSNDNVDSQALRKKPYHSKLLTAPKKSARRQSSVRRSTVDEVSQRRSGVFVNFSKPRFSTIGRGAAQVNDIIAEAIWSSPALEENDLHFQRMELPRAPPRSFASTNLFFDNIRDEHTEFPMEDLRDLPCPQYSQQHGPLPVSEYLSVPSVMDSPSNHRLQQDIIGSAKDQAIQQDMSDQEQLTFNDIFQTVWPALSLKQKIVLISGFVAAFIVGACTPAFAYVFALLLSVFYESRDQVGEARTYCLLLLGIAITDGVSSFCYHYAFEYCGQAWISALRTEGLRRILAQPKSWFDKSENNSGRLTEILDRNAEEMRNLIGRFVGALFVAFWMIMISVVWAFTISWKLSLVTLGTAPFMYTATRVFDHVSAKWEARCNDAADAASAIFTETFTSIRVIRALTLEQYFTSKHSQLTQVAYQIGKRRATFSGALLGCGDSMSFFISGLVFYYGATLFSKRELSVDGTLQVIQLLMFGVANATATLVYIPQINSSRAAATQMLRLARMLLSSHESTGQHRLSTPFPISMNKLNFIYASKQTKETLSDITITLKPGTCTALVGPSGSGKSTITSLLLGLYAPDRTTHYHPTLTFNHIPISTCCTTTLRTQIAHVPQHPHLFPTTILSNILYGLAIDHPLATLAQATLAAEEAGIHDFIASLPNGYNTLIGEGGMSLSGGQTQRIAIARAIVRRPSVLILDEATSALDAINAEGIRRMIRRYLRGEDGRYQERCVLTVSHGVEMMRIADEVVVLEGGRVVEKGGFEELRMRGGRICALLGEGKNKESRKDVVGPSSSGRKRDAGLGLEFDRVASF